MSMINLSVKHGRTLEEARSRMETAVHEVHSLCRALVRQVVWSTDRNQVRLDGVGFWVEMRVDVPSNLIAKDHSPSFTFHILNPVSPLELDESDLAPE